ncbi:MAG: hypothetical protein NZ772_16220 [Cyanobacteria bacterium]|nr:hypothetical protein [Cyanobacteriota bacterium]MDW8202893.1 hypothetical protein [Cyanobacteriota bacterium SKYGB_h_bin112]
MTHDITQWLEEIKHLKQKLAEAYQQRDDAYASVANWRKLYETEAQQRRSDVMAAQAQIEQLRATIEQLQKKPTISPDDATQAILQQELAGLKTPEQLRQKLLELMMERDRLTTALETEQANHAYTRRTLTTALGDTVALLHQERGNRVSNLHDNPMS